MNPLHWYYRKRNSRRLTNALMCCDLSSLSYALAGSTKHVPEDLLSWSRAFLRIGSALEHYTTNAKDRAAIDGLLEATSDHAVASTILEIDATSASLIHLGIVSAAITEDNSAKAFAAAENCKDEEVASIAWRKLTLDAFMRGDVGLAVKACQRLHRVDFRRDALRDMFVASLVRRDIEGAQLAMRSSAFQDEFLVSLIAFVAHFERPWSEIDIVARSTARHPEDVIIHLSLAAAARQDYSRLAEYIGLFNQGDREGYAMTFVSALLLIGRTSEAQKLAHCLLGEQQLLMHRAYCAVHLDLPKEEGIALLAPYLHSEKLIPLLFTHPIAEKLFSGRARDALFMLDNIEGRGSLPIKKALIDALLALLMAKDRYARQLSEFAVALAFGRPFPPKHKRP